MNKPTKSHVDAAQEIAEAFLCQGPVTENELYCIASNIISKHFPDWMPIETFDKRTKAVLVFCEERKNTYAVIWMEGTWKHFCQGDPPLLEWPTHWMPLPTIPLTNGGKSNEN